jgi:hypothetical protein
VNGEIKSFGDGSAFLFKKTPTTLTIIFCVDTKHILLYVQS